MDNFFGFLGLQADSSHAFAALMEDQPVEVVGQVAKGQLRFGTGQADGSDEQPESVLLMGEDVFDMARIEDLAALARAAAFGMGLPMGLRRWMRDISIRPNRHLPVF